MNRDTPCSNCVRSRNGTCVYEIHPSQPPRQQLNQRQAADINLAQKSPESISVDRTFSTSRASTVPSYTSSSVLASSTSASTLASQPSSLDIESMKNRIRQLEEQLSKMTIRSIKPSLSPSFKIETITSCLSGTFHVHRENSHPSTRGVMHKTRQFGQSHWINIVELFQDILKIIEPHLREDISEVLSGIKKCKSLAYVIKTRRAPQWPLPPTADLPSKDVADKLVDCYLRTTETFYRILHIPAFRRDYETLWVSNTEPDTAFMVQLKLVLAIGATTYDERFSLRSSAIRWVYEAQTWLSEPKFKSRLDIQFLQINLLLLLARETAAVSSDSIWISAGALLRRAMYMGLHIDPVRLPKRSTFATEMRRRLWNTILDVTLQLSLTSGGPPLISLNDFDTEPPGNFDDDQLVAEGPTPKPEDDFTQVTIATVLRKTFPLRLAITKFLNDLGSHSTYEETLRLDAELRASYKALCRTLQRCNSSTGSSPSRFELHIVDFLMHRYISALHVPFFAQSLRETAYAFSRKVVVETSLKIWCAAYPSSSILTAQSSSDTVSSDRNDLARLSVCSSGFYRTVPLQAALLIAVELKTQMQEEESLGPVHLRPDLLSVLDDVKIWCLRSIEAGETSIKGYLLMCVVAAQIDGLMRGLAEDETAELLVKAAEGAKDRGLSMLKEMWGQTQAERAADNQMSMNTPPEVMEDWDFTMADFLFSPDNTGSMNWMLNDETTEESYFVDQTLAMGS